jgi:ABC-type proline/glycine betaine transport system ATPase subunit
MDENSNNSDCRKIIQIRNAQTIENVICELDFHREILSSVKKNFEIFKESSNLERSQFMSMVLQGPSGSGKSTVLKYDGKYVKCLV